VAAPHQALFEAPAAHEAAGGPVHESEADGFATRVQPVPGLPGHAEGHEVITRVAAASLPVDLPALLRGVIRPDRGGNSYFNFPGAALHVADPVEQRRHCLRRTPGTSTPAALSEIRVWFTTVYRRALGAPNRAAAFEWIGEAAHLLQDSYSKAHTERAFGAGLGGTHPIRKVRSFVLGVFPPRRSVGPDEHNAPKDSRDDIYDSSARLKYEAGLARDATRELLVMAVRHLRTPTDPAIPAEVRAFMDRHLRM
jgi:hypothetical protein